MLRMSEIERNKWEWLSESVENRNSELNRGMSEKLREEVYRNRSTWLITTTWWFMPVVNDQ
jgi:hypothetical protein